jgi:hypothetical protein
MEFLFPEKLLVGTYGGIVVAILLGLIELPRWKDASIIALFGSVLAVLPLVMRLLLCRERIHESVSRYQNETKRRMGYGGNAVGEVWPR